MAKLSYRTYLFQTRGALNSIYRKLGLPLFTEELPKERKELHKFYEKLIAHMELLAQPKSILLLQENTVATQEYHKFKKLLALKSK